MGKMKLVYGLAASVIAAAIAGGSVIGASEIKKIKDSNTEYVAQIEQLQNENGDLQTELDAKNTSLNEVRGMLSLANASLIQANADKASLQTQLNQAISLKLSLESQISSLETDKTNLIRQIGELNTQINNLNTSITQKDNEIAMKTATINNLIQLNTSLENENNELKAFRYGKFVWIDGDDTSYIEVFDNGTVKYFVDNENFIVCPYTQDENIITVEFTEDNLTYDMQFEITSPTSFKNVEDEEMTFVYLTDELESAIEDKETAVAENAVLQSSVSTLQASVSTLQSDYSNVSSQLETANADLAQANALVSELNSLVVEKNQTIADLTAEKTALETRIAELETQIAELRDTSDAYVLADLIGYYFSSDNHYFGFDLNQRFQASKSELEYYCSLNNISEIYGRYRVSYNISSANISGSTVANYHRRYNASEFYDGIFTCSTSVEVVDKFDNAIDLNDFGDYCYLTCVSVNFETYSTEETSELSDGAVVVDDILKSVHIKLVADHYYDVYSNYVSYDFSDGVNTIRIVSVMYETNEANKYCVVLADIPGDKIMVITGADTIEIDGITYTRVNNNY